MRTVITLLTSSSDAPSYVCRTGDDHCSPLAGKRTAIKFGTYDSNFSLCFAFFVNAAILIVAGAAFFYGPSGGKNVAYISDAYHLIAPAVRP